MNIWAYKRLLSFTVSFSTGKYKNISMEKVNIYDTSLCPIYFVCILKLLVTVQRWTRTISKLLYWVRKPKTFNYIITTYKQYKLYYLSIAHSVMQSLLMFKTFKCNSYMQRSDKLLLDTGQQAVHMECHSLFNPFTVYYGKTCCSLDGNRVPNIQSNVMLRGRNWCLEHKLSSKVDDDITVPWNQGVQRKRGSGQWVKHKN